MRGKAIIAGGGIGGLSAAIALRPIRCFRIWDKAAVPEALLVRQFEWLLGFDATSQ